MKTRTLAAWEAILGAVVLVLLAPNARDGQAAESTLSSVQIPDFHFTGPYVCDNLTVFLVHGEDRIKDSAMLTLQEALDQRKVVVHETGNVNELSIENLSRDADVFVQAGDIVTGGQQDRIMAMDSVLPPAKRGARPEPIAIAAYCVEAGRWRQRGAEASTRFEASAGAVPGKELKTAALVAVARGVQSGATGAVTSPAMQLATPRAGSGEGSGGGAGRAATGQQGVWLQVSALQRKLERNLQANVRATASPSSLGLTLENSAVQEATTKYVRTLSKIVQNASDVLGFVFAVNGELNSAEVYGSHRLFLKLWPKLLKSSAIEAVAESGNAKKKSLKVTMETINRLFETASRGKSASRDLSARVRLAVLESDRTILFETRDRAWGQAWIHRSYLSK